jgi:hypothetical protein
MRRRAVQWPRGGGDLQLRACGLCGGRTLQLLAHFADALAADYPALAPTVEAGFISIDG